MTQSRFSISGIAIRRHIATIMLALAIIVTGIFFITTIQVDLLPAITYPRIGVKIFSLPQNNPPFSQNCQFLG